MLLLPTVHSATSLGNLQEETKQEINGIGKETSEKENTKVARMTEKTCLYSDSCHVPNCVIACKCFVVIANSTHIIPLKDVSHSLFWAN